MTAVLYDEVVPNDPASKLTLAATPTKAPKRLRRPVEPPGDPLIDASVHLLSIPLRHLYAVLWRAGVIEVNV